MEIPDTPTLLNLTLENNDFINITWSDPEYTGGPPITDFEVQKSIDDGSFQTYITVNATTQTNTVFDPFIEPDRKYSYRVLAINSEGRSEPSNVESIIIHTPPKPPQNVMVNILDGALNIEWEHSQPTRYSPVKNYNISFFVNDTWMTPLSVISANDTSFMYYGLNGNSVIIRLWASNEYGISDHVEVRGTPGRVPDPPSLHNINDQSPGIPKMAKLSWYAPFSNGGYGVIRYHIYRSEGEGEFQRIISLNHLHRSYNDEDVIMDVSYRYYITAENDLGESEPSQIQSYTQPELHEPPPAPEIYLTTKGILYIHIHWKMEDYDSLPLTEFIVYRNWSESGQDQNDAYNITPNQASYNDTDIKFDINYTYQVVAVNHAGFSPKSNLIDIRVRNITEPPQNTTTIKKGPNLALIYGLVGATIILMAAGVIYFVMTKRSDFDPPPEEFEMEPEPLRSSVTRSDRGGP